MNTERHAIDQLLGRGTIAYHVAFAAIGGGALAGLFLSQLYYWDDRGQRADGFIYKTQDEWQRETGLTRRQQESARKQLKAHGLIEEHKHSVPARLHYRIDKAAVVNALSSLAQPYKLECTKRTNKHGGSVQTIPETTTETTTETLEDRPRKKTRPPTPPAVKTFRHWTHCYPAKSWYTTLANAIGDDPVNLDKWGQIVHQWVGTGWNPRSVKGMLEVYNCGWRNPSRGPTPLTSTNAVLDKMMAEAETAAR